MAKTKTQTQYFNHLDGSLSLADLEHLTVECSSRSKKTVQQCKKLIREGNYGKALEIGDPIAFNVGLNDFMR